MTTSSEAELSRRVARAMHLGSPTFDERQQIIAALSGVSRWNDLPRNIQVKIIKWEKQSPTQGDDNDD